MKNLTELDLKEIAGGEGFFLGLGHAIGYAVGAAAHEIYNAATSQAGEAAISQAYTSGAAV